MARAAVFQGHQVWLLGASARPGVSATALLITSAAGSGLREVVAVAGRGDGDRRLLLADGTPDGPSCGPLAAWAAELDALSPGTELWGALSHRPDRSTASVDPSAAVRGPDAVYADAILDSVLARRRLMAAL